ncbi:MAG: 4Fe-4S ferredoxin, partial [Rhodospirillales bacterium]
MREDGPKTEQASQGLLLCSCEKTMALDAEAIGKALGCPAPTIHHQLCRQDHGAFERALGQGAALTVACTQESPLFLETSADQESAADLSFVNIREKAGWSEAGPNAGPKIAALLAEARVPVKGAQALELDSKGIAFVIGAGQETLDAALQLGTRMDVTLLLTGGLDDILPPRLMTIPLFAGRILSAAGHLGAFTVRVADFAPVKPSSRGKLERDGAGSQGESA